MKKIFTYLGWVFAIFFILKFSGIVDLDELHEAEKEKKNDNPISMLNLQMDNTPHKDKEENNIYRENDIPNSGDQINAKNLIKIASEKYESGNYDEAKELYEAAISAGGNLNYIEYFYLGRIYGYHSSRTDKFKAEKAFIKSIELSPPISQPMENLEQFNL